jgi:hypothetical protein
MNQPFYFTGKYGEVGHENEQAGQDFIAGYPVFFTYNKENPKEKHNSARFVHSEDAELWARIKNS